MRLWRVPLSKWGFTLLPMSTCIAIASSCAAASSKDGESEAAARQPLVLETPGPLSAALVGSNFQASVGVSGAENAMAWAPCTTIFTPPPTGCVMNAFVKDTEGSSIYWAFDLLGTPAAHKASSTWGSPHPSTPPNGGAWDGTYILDPQVVAVPYDSAGNSTPFRFAVFTFASNTTQPRNVVMAVTDDSGAHWRVDYVDTTSMGGDGDHPSAVVDPATGKIYVAFKVSTGVWLRSITTAVDPINTAPTMSTPWQYTPPNNGQSCSSASQCPSGLRYTCKNSLCTRPVDTPFSIVFEPDVALGLPAIRLVMTNQHTSVDACDPTAIKTDWWFSTNWPAQSSSWTHVDPLAGR